MNDLVMSRRPFSEEDRKYVFNRENGHCKICHKRLVFSNRRRDLTGAWEMGHRKAYANGGTSHLRNIVALCWKHNLEQGTTSFAEEDKKFDFISMKDKAKNFLNNELLPNATQFDMSSAPRSKMMEAELQDFKRKIKNLSLERAKEIHNSMAPQGTRFLKGDKSYEIYYRKCIIIQEVFRLNG